jgi:hypothetical protein
MELGERRARKGMEANVTDVDEAIATYRRRVQAQADLAEGDLDELEAHLRELTDELRTAGMSAAEAVTEAARRLGDPRELAREHARVRSQFGAPLPAARAWSAAILYAVPLVFGIVRTIAAAAESSHPPFPLRMWFDFGAFVVMTVALATRRPWARGLVLGAKAYVLTHVGASSMLFPWRPGAPSWFWLVELGVVAFVMPWRRREISPAAIGLALLVWAYCPASFQDQLFFKAYEANLTIAYACAAAACVGTVLRARWSVIASAVSALALFGVMFSELGELMMSRSELDVWWVFNFGKISSGAIAASVAAILAWRTTRVATGTYRSLTQTQVMP